MAYKTNLKRTLGAVACADRTDGSCVAAAVGVARHFPPIWLALFRTWLLACAVVGSAEPVVVGNIAAAAAVVMMAIVHVLVLLSVMHLMVPIYWRHRGSWMCLMMMLLLLLSLRRRCRRLLLRRVLCSHADESGNEYRRTSVSRHCERLDPELFYRRFASSSALVVNCFVSTKRRRCLAEFESNGKLRKQLWECTCVHLVSSLVVDSWISSSHLLSNTITIIINNNNNNNNNN